MPMFINSKDMFLSNLGPSIYVPINFVGSVLTNIKTKITDYGINNAWWKYMLLLCLIQINKSSGGKE